MNTCIHVPRLMYPPSPIAVVNPETVIPRFRKTVKALEKVKRSIPRTERWRRIKEIVRQLNNVYGLNINVKLNNYACYAIHEKTIYLGKPSIVSCLHEYAHALEHHGVYHPRCANVVFLWKHGGRWVECGNCNVLLTGEWWAVAYSVTLFKHVWPRAFEKLVPDGHLLVMPKA